MALRQKTAPTSECNHHVRSHSSKIQARDTQRWILQRIFSGCFGSRIHRASCSSVAKRKIKTRDVYVTHGAPSSPGPVSWMAACFVSLAALTSPCQSQHVCWSIGSEVLAVLVATVRKMDRNFLSSSKNSRPRGCMTVIHLSTQRLTSASVRGLKEACMLLWAEQHGCTILYYILNYTIL